MEGVNGLETPNEYYQKLTEELASMVFCDTPNPELVAEKIFDIEEYGDFEVFITPRMVAFSNLKFGENGLQESFVARKIEVI